MDRFKVANISYKIDGYFSKSRCEIGSAYKKPTDQEAFEKAKQELIKNIKTELEMIEKLNLEQFIAVKKRGFM